MNSVRRKPSFEPLPLWLAPPCRRCGALGRAVLTDPDGLCEFCLLQQYGIIPADDQEWVVSWIEGGQLDRGVAEHYFPDEIDTLDFTDWTGYYLDYVGFVIEEESDADGPILTSKGKRLQLRLMRGFYDGLSLCVEVLWAPLTGYRINIRMLDPNHFPTSTELTGARRCLKFLNVHYTGPGRPPAPLDLQEVRNVCRRYLDRYGQPVQATELPKILADSYSLSESHMNDKLRELRATTKLSTKQIINGE